jgi:hypothetical protein
MNSVTVSVPIVSLLSRAAFAPADRAAGPSSSALVRGRTAADEPARRRASGDRGTVRFTLEDVRRFDSGIVLLTYLPAG